MVVWLCASMDVCKTHTLPWGWFYYYKLDIRTGDGLEGAPQFLPFPQFLHFAIVFFLQSLDNINIRVIGHINKTFCPGMDFIQIISKNCFIWLEEYCQLVVIAMFHTVTGTIIKVIEAVGQISLWKCYSMYKLLNSVLKQNKANQQANSRNINIYFKQKKRLEKTLLSDGRFYHILLDLLNEKIINFE